MKFSTVLDENKIDDKRQVKYSGVTFNQFPTFQAKTKNGF